MKNRKQRTFNQWVFIGILAVLAVMVTACTPQKEQTESSTQQQTATESGRIAEQTQTTAPFNPHPEILNGDLSAFAGTWEETASQSLPQEPADLTGEWHSRSITDSCYGQEHYIFTADGYL